MADEGDAGRYIIMGIKKVLKSTFNGGNDDS